MTLTINQVLQWDVGSLEAAGASLESSAANITEIAAALPKNTGHGGRSIGQSWLASSWSGPSAIAAQGAARDITKNLEGLAELVLMAGQAITHCATKIDIAQEKLRSVKEAVASHDSMTLTSDGRVLVPAYVEPDGSDSPFGASDFQGEANNALLLQGQAQEALTNARIADEQLCAYLRYYFEGIALPNPSTAAVVASTIVDLIPFIGVVKVYIESAMGESIFTGQILSDQDRLLGALTAGASSGAAVFRFGSAFVRDSDALMHPGLVHAPPVVGRPPLPGVTRPVTEVVPVPGNGARPHVPQHPFAAPNPAAIHTDPARTYNPTSPTRDTDGYESLVVPATPAEQALANSSAVTRQPWTFSGINSSYSVSMSDGSRGIFKPSSEEFANLAPEARVGYHYNFPEGSQYAREVAVSRVDEALGFNLVPTTTVWGDSQLGVGSIQRIHEHISPSRPASAYAIADQDRMAVLDYITGNWDRHSSNYLTDVATGRPVAIDHGLSLPVHNSEKLESDFVVEALNRPLTPEVLAQVQSVDTVQLRDLLLDSGMEFAAVANAIERLHEIQRMGMITGQSWAGPILGARM